VNHAYLTDGTKFPTPISKVVCVGRNYAAHAAELNNPVPSSPLLFMKPNSAVVPFSGQIIIPREMGAVHFETELAILLGKPLSKASSEQANAAIAGIGIALDLTLRALQAELKRQGYPWEKAKAFDGSCPLSEFVPYQGQPLDNLEFAMSLNGVLRQQGNTAMMLVGVLPLLAMISHHFCLCPGDVVLTGTPEGVGALAVGDRLEVTGLANIVATCLIADQL
jgi:2-keto-4-pentenoate hydratase/2-oxohepta-3-ene-1,7-dioic acid hydratase in catechol pathway